MAAGLVSAATCEKLPETDWGKNIEICELVARDHRVAKDVVKAIKKRLASKNPNTQLYAVMLLEMLINNIGEPVHIQVVDTGILPLLVKMVKKKSDLPVREKIFLLLDAAQTSVGGASGRFPQFYSAYYELVSAGVEFPRRPNDVARSQSATTVNNGNPHNANHAAAPIVNIGNPHNASLVAAPAPAQNERSASQAVPEKVLDSGILQKAGAAFEVLSDVLGAIDAQHPESAKDEFTLDLVEQCSFQKQRVMHLALTSRDERIVSKAVELNEDLERILKKHDALLEKSTTSRSNHLNQYDTEEEEEEAEQLSRRIRKGKACVRSEDEPLSNDRPLGMLGSYVRGEMINRPLIRPLRDETKQDYSEGRGGSAAAAAAVIPPPPAKHYERERYFQENRLDGATTLGGHMRGLSLHSRNGSTSLSGSVDFSD